MPEGSGLADIIEAHDDMQVVTRLDAVDDLENECDGDSDSDVDDVEVDDDTDEEIERARRASADPLPVAPGEWQGSV